VDNRRNKITPIIPHPFTERGGESAGGGGRENTPKEEDSDPNTSSKLGEEQSRGGSPRIATVGERR